MRYLLLLYGDAEGEANAALYSAAALTIAGTGSLDVTGNANDGIAAQDGLVVTYGDKIAWADRLGEYFSDYSFSAAEGAGHFVHYERPEAANRRDHRVLL